MFVDTDAYVLFAETAHAAGTATQATPLIRWVLARQVRDERFGRWTAPSQLDSTLVDEEVDRRFIALPKGDFSAFGSKRLKA